MKSRQLYIILMAAALIVCGMQSAYAANCTVRTESLDKNTTLITAPGGAKFKIDDKHIKTLLPEAFDQEKWTSIDLTKGAGKITGVIEDGNKEKVISVFIVLKKGGHTNWFLAVNKDMEHAKGKWTVISSIKNNLSCSEASSLQEADIDEEKLKPYGLRKAKIKITSPGYVYNRLGI